MGTHPIFESDFDCLTDKMNSLLCRSVLSQNTKSCMVVKRANSFLVRSSKVPNGTLSLIYQTRTIISGSSLNRKEKLTFEEQELKNKTALYYMLSVALFFLGLGFWSVPLYRAFCESVGMGDSTQLGLKGHDSSKVETMEPIYEHPIVVRFKASTTSGLPWKFTPCQESIIVYPGETALAFYTATNETNEPIIGVSTYNLIPYEIGMYFNKIQCFCFEEQILNPGESVDMPVFFFIDPDVDEDPNCFNMEAVALNYTFHRVQSMEELPRLPGFEHIKVQKAESLVKPPF